MSVDLLVPTGAFTDLQFQLVRHNHVKVVGTALLKQQALGIAKSRRADRVVGYQEGNLAGELKAVKTGASQRPLMCVTVANALPSHLLLPLPKKPVKPIQHQIK